MVRPNSLRNKARFSRDFASLGRVVAVLCGNRHIRRDDLTEAELAALEEIEAENEEMERHMALAAKRKAEYRAAKMSRGQARTSEDKRGQDTMSHDVSQCPTMSHDVSPCLAVSPPNKQTNKQTNDTNKQTNKRLFSLAREEGGVGGDCAQGALSLSPAPAQGRPPTVEEVVAFASDAATKPSGRAIPEGFARGWHAMMAGAGWRNSRGRSVLANWRQDLVYAHRREEAFASRGDGKGNGKAGGQPIGQIRHEEGYANPL